MQRQPVPRGDGPRLLPPLRDRLQPRAARRGGRDQLGRALPRRRGDRARLELPAPRARRRAARARRRRRALRPVGRLPPRAARPRGRRSTTRARARRHDALRDPHLPAAARGARRRDRADPRARASTLRARRTVTDLRAAMREGGFDAAFLAVGAQLGQRAYIPAGERRAVLDAVSLLRGMEDGRAPAARPRAWSSTAAATPRWTPRAPPSGSARASAIIVYRRTRERMPAHDVELEEALAGGRRRCAGSRRSSRPTRGAAA